MRAPLCRLVLALACALALVPLPAGAVIFYSVSVGARQPEFFTFMLDRTEPQKIDISEFSYGGSLCPAPGTPDFLCGRLYSEAGNNGGRLFLRSAVSLKRTDADPSVHPEVAGYADTTIWISEMGGWVAPGPAPFAAFYFGLSGTLVQSSTSGTAAVGAFARATLQAGSGGGVQCIGQIDCPPQETVYRVLVEDWNPTQGFRLNLRSDAYASAFFNSPGGWDAEAVADFADTLEILAIEVLDEKGVRMPDVVLSALDSNGAPVVTFSNVPVPEPGQALLALTGGLVCAVAGKRRA
jgi:hypothetical protein